jgi:16S rRNA processing protein RimM
LNEVSSEKLLLMGKVIRPHGLDGLLRIFSYAESGSSFIRAGTVLLKSDQMEISEHEVISIRAHKKALLLKLKGISSLEDAERYQGAEILIRKEALGPKNDDEYFWFELIGLEVFLNSGPFVGLLQEIINTGSNDIYIVKAGNKEVLIPAVQGIVLKIDLVNKKMIIADDIDGLPDINEV